MILFESVQFSCAKCLAGHRAITCTHINSKLTELKAGGRPVTQCGQCRVTRSNKKATHHQCLCGESTSKKRVEFKFADELSFVCEFEPAAIADINASIQANASQGVVVLKRRNASTKAYDLVTSLNVAFVGMDELGPEIPSIGAIERMIVNPCRCHFGEPCLCSTLPKKPSKAKKIESCYTRVTEQAANAISEMRQGYHPYKQQKMASVEEKSSCCTASIFKSTAPVKQVESCCSDASTSGCKSASAMCKCDHSTLPADHDGCGCGCGVSECAACVSTLCDEGFKQYLND